MPGVGATWTRLAGLFVSQLGHGRRELVEAGAKQAGELAFFPLWSYAHPTAIQLAERLATMTPGDLNRIFFTSGGGEAVESAWKLAKNYFKLVGKPLKHKVISRAVAYHGTTQGALSITGLPAPQGGLRAAGAVHLPGAEHQLLPGPASSSPGRRTTWRPSAAGPPTRSPWPSSRRAPTRWRRCSSSRCRTPAAASRRRPATSPASGRSAIAYDVLLVSDEVICAFGRLGHMFGAERYGYVPDMITCAKGLTSGYSPLGAMIASDRLMEPFLHGTETFLHGYTFGGHPVSTAVAMANLDVFERDHVNEHVRANEGAFRATLERLLDLPIVGRRPRRRLLLRHRTGQGRRRPRRPSTPTNPSGCCAASCPRPCSRPGSTVGPTTAAIPSSSSLRR